MPFEHAVIERLRSGGDLAAGQMTGFMADLIDGKLSDDEIVAFLLALRGRGEKTPDLVEAAAIMRSRCVSLELFEPNLVDTCGTGGDGQGTLNASTLAALVAAAAGARVAKHGNRSVSGIFGSADLLEALGIRIELTPREAARSIEQTGFGFLFAPLFHPAMKHAASARKKIAGKTLFNCLGPLTNPAGAKRHLIGVYDRNLLAPFAEALKTLGSTHALIVHGDDGLDEVTLSGLTHVTELRHGAIHAYTISPEALGVPRAPLERLRCRNREEAFEAAQIVLDGGEGPRTDFVVLNAAFALKAAGLLEDPREGVSEARSLLREGAVRRKAEAIRGLFPR